VLVVGPPLPENGRQGKRELVLFDFTDLRAL
jgi:hypothetical protein